MLAVIMAFEWLLKWGGLLLLGLLVAMTGGILGGFAWSLIA